MARFALFAVPCLVVLTALFQLAVELLMAVGTLAPEPALAPLVGWRAGDSGLAGAWVLAGWVLEALALTALFSLVTGGLTGDPVTGKLVAGDPETGGLAAGTGRRPAGRLVVDGLLTGWIAWVFRGPLLVLAAVGYGGQAGGPWWRLSLRWFVLYTLAGLLLATLAHTLSRPPKERP